ASVLAALKRQAVLLQRFVVIALLSEREPEVVVSQLVALHHLGLGGEALAPLLALTLGVVALEREVGLRAGERRVQLDGALRRDAGVLMPAQVAQYERHQIVGVGVVG